MPKTITQRCADVGLTLGNKGKFLNYEGERRYCIKVNNQYMPWGEMRAKLDRLEMLQAKSDPALSLLAKAK